MNTLTDSQTDGVPNPLYPDDKKKKKKKLDRHDDEYEKY
eukprot:SAG22_NODE_10190_length_548_cov_1.153675_1_plen_38_part_10